jgi:uncharacterized alpha-E superfamily protein
VGQSLGGSTEPRVVEAVLMVAESVITHRRREAAGATGHSPVGAVLELLLLDHTNPRGVAFQLDRLAGDLARLPPTASSDRIAALHSTLAARLAACDVDQAVGGDWLAGLDADLRHLANQLTQAHFVHKAPQQAMPGSWGHS